MIRELLHIDQVKSLTEETLNCWLSYTMSQPVQFDMAIIGCLMLQYVGVSHFVNRRTNKSENLDQVSF